MLRTLNRIVQEVSTTDDLQEALQIMVDRVRTAINTEAATLFIIDHRHAEYVLMATDGLNPSCVGKVRFSLDKGLVGYVGRREEPINIERAQDHPEFLYNPYVGEEKYSVFLGVPIIHHRRLLGVLTVQQTDERSYDEDEEAFLVTIAAQFGTIIASAEASGELYRLSAFSSKSTPSDEEIIVSGIPSVPGVGIGQAVVVFPPADLDAVPDNLTDDIEAEVQIFERALENARDEIQRLGERLAGSISPEEQALFDVYLRILHDQGIGKEVCDLIREEKLWAQAALKKVINQYIHNFESMEDNYLRERASDFRDLGRRVLAQLQSSQIVTIEYPENTILVGEELNAADLADVPEGALKAIVSAKGSNNSHVAILARALGVPTVMGAAGISLATANQANLIVDGYFGQVYVHPSPDLIVEFERLADEERALNASLAELREEPAETLDGHRVALHVNTGLAADASLSMTVGAEGIGLYRSEVPFMTRDRFPSEEEQRVIYRQLLKAFAPRYVTMRTLDIGGDKTLPYFPVEEDNPFLGWRGIRVTLDHPDVFLMQIRAMLKASEGLSNLRIMLPMITSVSEVDEAKNLIEQAYVEVVEEGLAIKPPQLGVMIEVPSAVYQARELAKRVDFLSIGSNDLTQYVLAVDRNNARVAGLYEALHPAILKALLQVVEGAHAEGKQVSICGEMAADPASVILLLAMDFDALSMNSTSLPRIKWVIRKFTLQQARKILNEVLTMENPTLIRFHLEKALEQAGLGGLIRAGNR